MSCRPCGLFSASRASGLRGLRGFTGFSGAGGFHNSGFRSAGSQQNLP